MGIVTKKSVASNKASDKNALLSAFKATMHVVTSDELKASRNPLYQYMIGRYGGRWVGFHENTRSYKLYCRLVENYISDAYFQHIWNDAHSLYLLVNKLQIESDINFAVMLVERLLNRFMIED